MSSDQFSENPTAGSRKMTCPECGAEAPTRAAVACWLCGAKMAAEPQPHGRRTSAPMRGGAWAGGSVIWVIFGVIAILLAGAMALEKPGILIVLLVLAMPAVGLIYAYVNYSRKHNQAVPASKLNFFVFYLRTLGIILVIVLALYAALWMVYLAAGLY